MATDYGIRWGIMFQREDLDKDRMKQYIEEMGTKVEDIIDDTVELADPGSDNWSTHECTIFVLFTPNRMFVPVNIVWSLNLQAIPNQSYLYMPVERHGWGA